MARRHSRCEPARIVELGEVAQRVAGGKTNDVPTRAARSVSEIVRANVFTRINAILSVLLVIVLSTGSVINGAFGLLIIAKSVALAVLAAIGYLHRRRTLGPAASGRLLPLLGLAAGELIIMSATIGIAVALSSTAFA